MSKNRNQLQSYICTHQPSQSIQYISIPENWSLPQFSFGQIVKWEWEFNRKTYDCYGLVIGLCYSTDQIFAETGWHYSILVMNDLLNVADCLQLSEIEDLHESVLQTC